jgi:hypothetical protein
MKVVFKHEHILFYIATKGPATCEGIFRCKDLQIAKSIKEGIIY